MKVLVHTLSIVFTVSLSHTALANRAAALPKPLERPVETAKEKNEKPKVEDATKGFLIQSPPEMVRAANDNVVSSANVTRLQRQCKTSCKNVDLLRDMHDNPARYELDAKGIENVKKVAANANEIVKKEKIDSDTAVVKGWEKEGIDPKEIEEACAR